MSYRVADEMDVVRFLAEEYDPWVHAVRDEPPELTDDDYDLDLSDETPEDRQTLIALMWRREWMATR